MIVGFNAGRARLRRRRAAARISTRNRPAIVALQQQGLGADVADSAAFFMSTPRAGRLAAGRLRPRQRARRVRRLAAAERDAVSAPAAFGRPLARGDCCSSRSSRSLRGVFPTADPPWRPRVGIVWHDEGAWVHNARNMALFGAWRAGRVEPDVHRAGVHRRSSTSSFAAFGVGVLAGAAGRRSCRARCRCCCSRSASAGSPGARRGAHRRRAARDQLRLRDVEPRRADGSARWSPSSSPPGTATCARRRSRAVGALAGACALLAFFTKAAAAFFVAALGARTRLVADRCMRCGRTARSRRDGRAAIDDAGGLGGCRLAGSSRAVRRCRTGPTTGSTTGRCRSRASRATTCASLLNARDVVPDPARHLHADVVHASSSGCSALWGIAGALAHGAAGRAAAACCGSRLGALELLVHDVGNERRFVFFIPALVALAAWCSAAIGALLPEAVAACRAGARCSRSPVVLYTRLRRARRARAAAVSLRGLAPSVQARSGRRSRRARARRWSIAAWPRARRGCSRPRRGRPCGRGCWSSRWSRPGNLAQFGAVGARTGPTRTTRRRVDARPGAAARHAGPRQAGQRPGAREPDPAGLRRPRVRQLRGPEAARRCAIYFDLHRPGSATKGSQYSGRARRLPGATIIMTFDVAETAAGPAQRYRQVRRLDRRRAVRAHD